MEMSTVTILSQVSILFACIFVRTCWGCDLSSCVEDQSFHFCLRTNEDIKPSLQIPDPSADEATPDGVDWNWVRPSDDNCLDLLDVAGDGQTSVYTDRVTIYDDFGIQLQDITAADSGVYYSETLVDGQMTCKMYDVYAIEPEAFESGDFEMLTNSLGNKTEISCGLAGQVGPLTLVEWVTPTGSRRKTSRKEGTKWIYEVPQNEENIQVKCRVNKTSLAEICPGFQEISEPVRSLLED